MDSTRAQKVLYAMMRGFRVKFDYGQYAFLEKGAEVKAYDRLYEATTTGVYLHVPGEVPVLYQGDFQQVLSLLDSVDDAQYKRLMTQLAAKEQGTGNAERFA